MKILIVEDDSSCRQMLVETAKYLAKAVGLELEILQTFCLEEAEILLEDADAVLCDGAFYRNQADLYRCGRVRENWPFMAGNAARRHIPFALLSGDQRSIDRARACGHQAFSKPGQSTAAIEFLLGAMGLKREERQTKGVGDNPVVVEVDAANREIWEEEEDDGKRKRQVA